MIDKHIEELRAKATGIEKRLAETNEKLSADEIIKLCYALSDHTNAMNYLLNIQKVRESEKLIQPVNNKLSLIK